MLQFIRVNHISNHADVTKMSLDDKEKLLPEEIFVRHHTPQNLEEEVLFSTSDAKKFREKCLAWWFTAAGEAIKRLPLGHSLLGNLHWLQPD